jgi:signal peptidase I, bacterial type
MKGKIKDSKIYKRLKKLLRFVYQMVVIILIAIILAVILRLFFIASFKIPTPSMEPAIVSGDFIIVNKMIPGPLIFKNFDFLSDGTRPEFWRLKGVRAVKRNDVLVFNFPYTDWHKMQLDMNVYYVKRCIAIPGDTFYIDNGIYKVKNVKDTLGYLPNQQGISGMGRERYSNEIWNTFPYDGELGWNVKDFGPLYLPKKGETLSLNAEEYKLYRRIIAYETGKTVSLKDNQVLLNDSVIDKYTFLTNYYFMSGDFTFDSRDSRYWGLLPEDHIVGKAAFVWKSKDIHTDKWRWNRLFKAVK